MKQNRFRFRGHFSGIGWTEFRDSGEVLWFEGTQLEALEIEADKQSIRITALNSKGETLRADKKIGITGKSIALKAITIEDEEKQYLFYIRVNLRKIGWTKFSKMGKLCGISDISQGLETIVIEGIQIICLLNDIVDGTESIMEEAEGKLVEYEEMSRRLFVSNQQKMLEAVARNYKREVTPKVLEVRNGGVLPLKKVERSRNGVFRGGICDENNIFVAGHVRKENVLMNLSCIEGYEADFFEYMDEEVIYGGILIGFFGHALTECTARIWWILQNIQNENKIVLLKAPGTGTISTIFFELAGIPKERLQFVEKPTRYRKIIVPEQSILLWGYVYPKEFLLPYNKMRERIEAAQYKKIYLTRTRLKRQDGVNEEYFEDFFERRGYKVLELEEHSIEQQIAFMKGAEEVICTAGTLSHMALFCNDGISLTIINRVTNHILLPQLLINQAKKLDVKWVDATFNFLPASHVCGPSLYGPTQLFRKFLDDNSWDYDKKEVEIDLSLYAMDYIQKWMEVYRDEKNFNEISGKDMYYVISTMYKALENPGLQVKYKTKLQDKIEKLTKENRLLKESMQ